MALQNNQDINFLKILIKSKDKVIYILTVHSSKSIYSLNAYLP